MAEAAEYKKIWLDKVADPKDPLTMETLEQLARIYPKQYIKGREFGAGSHNLRKVADIPEDGISLADLESGQVAILIGPDVKTSEKSGIFTMTLDGIKATKFGAYFANK